MVACVDLFLALLSSCSELLGFLDGLVDIVLGEICGGCDGDMLLLACSEILCRNIDDAVGVDIEGDFDLRYAAAGRSDTVQMEASERFIVVAISRSPCRTLTSTEVWLSAAVEKTWLFFVGIVVLRSISFVNTPPSVSMPSESGVTSSRRMPSTSPPRTPPWIAAPTATHSSGLMPLNGSLPVIFLTAS